MKTGRYYRGLAHELGDEVEARCAEIAGQKAKIEELRGLNKELTAALRRVRAERDELLAPIQRRTSALLIISVQHDAAVRWAREVGLEPHEYRICTEENHLRGYRNRRYVTIYWPSHGNRHWESMMRQLEMLVATGGFVSLDGRTDYKLSAS